jgi:outer membrane protein insertion porin family
MSTLLKKFGWLLVLLVAQANALMAQDSTEAPIDSLPDEVTAVNVTLENIFNQRSPKPYVIGVVKVTGNKYFDENLLMSIANVSTGDKVQIPGGDIFARAIEKLWKQGYFKEVNIYLTKLTGNTLDVEINVVELPRLNNYRFLNVKKGDEEDLVTKTAILKNRVVTENLKREIVSIVKKYYVEKGFRLVDVKVQEENVAGLENNKLLVISVNKGEKVKVDNVFFTGNKAISSGKLKKQLDGTKEKSRLRLFKDPEVPDSLQQSVKFVDYLKDYGFLSLTKTKQALDPYFRFKLFSSSKFDEAKYKSDKESIISHYNAEGYRDAQIVEDREFYTQNGLNKVLTVSEGRKYYFGNIVFKGNTRYNDSLLNVILNIRKGDVYNIETLNKRLGKQLSPEGGDISGLYMDDGYLFFRTEVIETSVYNDTIDHEVRIVEGPQATIDKVNISGNDRTKEYVIRRELRTMPGEKFSRQDLIRSQREIANLGFFNQEKIGINPVPNPEKGTVDINYSVEERSSDQLELSAGWGGQIGLTGTIGISFNNFSIKNIFKKAAWDPLPTGDGQKLSLRVQSNGRAFRSINFSFTEPWVGGKKRNSLSLSFYNTKFSNPQFGAGGIDYDQSFIETNGISIGYGKQLKWPDDFFNLQMSLNYTQYKLRNYQIISGFSNGVSNNFSIKFALSRSSVNQQIFPTGGSSFLLSAALTPPYSLFDESITKSSTNKYKFIEFHKWRFNGEWYVPIGKATGPDRNKQFVLKFAAKFGYIGRYNSELEISPFERFQVGDAGLQQQFSFLGFDVIAHRGYPVYESSDPKINPDQGQARNYFTIFNKYTAELRYPLSLNPSSTIFATAWFEAANGWYDFKDYNPFRLRRSVGVGMRFFLPMFGLLGFDYGIGLDRVDATGQLKDAARFTFMLGFEPE